MTRILDWGGRLVACAALAAAPIVMAAALDAPARAGANLAAYDTTKGNGLALTTARVLANCDHGKLTVTAEKPGAKGGRVTFTCVDDGVEWSVIMTFKRIDGRLYPDRFQYAG